MFKQLLKNSEVLDIIRKCYEADAAHMMTVLFDRENGLDFSINRTANDFIKNSIKLFTLTIDDKFIGYFGEESVNGNKFLTGFFIMPEYRKVYNKEFWIEVTNHFNCNFKVFISDLNQPAKKFLLKNKCQLVNQFDTKEYGMMNLLEYKGNN